MCYLLLLWGAILKVNLTTQMEPRYWIQGKWEAIPSKNIRDRGLRFSDKQLRLNLARHKAIYFSWFESELFCLLFGPPGFNCWFSFAPVFQWCCSTPQGSPGVGRNTFLSSPHLCFIIVFICDLFVSPDDPLMS